MEYTHWWGSHPHFSWILPFLVMVLMFVFVACFIRRTRGSGRRALWAPFACCSPGRGTRSRWWAETPRQILDRRYASGEITNEQYESIKRDIESGQSQNEPSDAS